MEQLGQCLRALGDGQLMGDLSLTIVLNSTDLHTIHRQMGEFAGIFTNADGSLFAETYNQLNALFATIPGNHAHNLRRNVHAAQQLRRRCLFCSPSTRGELTNPHLGTRVPGRVLETDNSTPYFLNLHNGEGCPTPSSAE